MKTPKILKKEEYLAQLLEQSKAQTKLLQEIYKQLLNPWTGKSPIGQNLAKEMGINTNKDSYFHIVDEGKLKTSEILAECKKKFDVWSYYDDAKLDKDFPSVKSDRYFKRNIEADEEYKNKSANELDKMGIKGVTLRERLILELQYFNETGQHLDIDNITLCSGSRCSDGYVPSVHWYVDHRELYVSAFGPGYAHDDLRTRAAQFPNP